MHVINNLLAPLVAFDPFDVEKVHEAMAFIKGTWPPRAASTWRCGHHGQGVDRPATSC